MVRLIIEEKTHLFVYDFNYQIKSHYLVAGVRV